MKRYSLLYNNERTAGGIQLFQLKDNKTGKLSFKATFEQISKFNECDIKFDWVMNQHNIILSLIIHQSFQI